MYFGGSAIRQSMSKLRDQGLKGYKSPRGRFGNHFTVDIINPPPPWNFMILEKEQNVGKIYESLNSAYMLTPLLEIWNYFNLEFNLK